MRDGVVVLGYLRFLAADRPMERAIRGSGGLQGRPVGARWVLGDLGVSGKIR